MRPDADKTRHPALEHPAQALLPRDIGDQLDHAFFDMRAHDASLDDVHGAADRSRYEAGHEGRGEMRCQVILQRGVVQQHRFEDVVGGQLADGHEDRAGAVGPHAFPQRSDAFFAGHADEPVKGVVVVAPLLGRQRAVVLHPHVEDVAWVAGHAAHEPGDGGYADEGEEGGFGVRGGEAVFEGFVDAEACHGVGYLAELGGGELGGGC